MERRACALLALLLVVIASARIVSTYYVLNHTMDEPEHLGDGMEWLSRGTYSLDTSHPPMARVMAAIPLYLNGARWIPVAGGGHQESMLLLGKDAHYEHALALARFGILPLFWIASFCVFLWARKIGGDLAAVIAVFLFTTIPPVLAHAGLVTTDMAATAFCGTAFYTSLWWTERPDRARTLVFGLILGLAALSKFSLLVYLPAGWLLLILWRRPELSAIRQRLAALAIAAAIAAAVLWAGYRFSFGPVAFANISLPAPALFKGLTDMLAHNKAGHDSYILGSRIRIGVWYFFPVVLGVKTPLAMLVLLAWASVRAWRRKLPVGEIVAFCAGILLIAMMGHINIGVRHVLPIYTGFSVICAVAAADLMRGSPLRMAALFVLFAWQAFSGASQHPDYIPYTNEITGNHPESFVAESDLDWGQDMKKVAAFLAQQGATHVAFTPYNGSYLDVVTTFPKTTPTDWYHPSQGWNVISLSGLKVYNHPGWVDDRQPQVRIGRTHWAWYVP